MKVSMISPTEIDQNLLEKWRALQLTSQTLDRPFYHPTFAKAIGMVRENARVAVIESDGDVVGFFPHEITGNAIVSNIGLGLNDYHGLIANLKSDMDVHEVLTQLGGRYWHFDHAPAEQASLCQYMHLRSVSPYMEIQGGLADFHGRLAAFQSTKKPGVIASMRKAENRLQRDRGPLRFVWNERSPGVMEKLMAWKSNQWLRTAGQSHDAFARSWVKSLLWNTHELEGQAFCGQLSSLYAGDTLVAAHFGFRASAVLHGSFASYDPELSYYMPGSLLIHKFAAHGHENGVSLFDMGRGTQDYKMRFATGFVDMGEGAVSRHQRMTDAHFKLIKLKISAKNKLKKIAWIANVHSRWKRQWSPTGVSEGNQ